MYTKTISVYTVCKMHEQAANVAFTHALDFDRSKSASPSEISFFFVLKQVGVFAC